jgi:hypothetical protein
MLIEGVKTKREKLKRKEKEAIASMVSMISHEHPHDSVNAPQRPLLVQFLMRHKKFKKTTGSLFQAQDQHDATI